MCNRLYCPISTEWIKKADEIFENIIRESREAIVEINKVNKKVDEIIKQYEQQQEGTL